MVNGFSYNRVINGSDGTPFDFIILEANDTFLDMTGLNRQSLGKRATELFPGIVKIPDLMNALRKTAYFGEKAKLEYYSNYSHQWFSFLAYSLEKGYFALIAADITDRKKTEEETERLASLLKLNLCPVL